MEEEFALDPKRIAKARLLTDLVILIMVGSGLIGITAWFTTHPVLFYISASICTLVAIVSVLGMIISGISQRGAGYIPTCILFFVIGMLVTHSFISGILLGGSMFGVYAMLPLAYHQIRMKRDLREKEIEDAVKGRMAAEDVLEPEPFPEDLVERVSTMEKAYDSVTEMVQSLNGSIDKYIELQSKIEMLQRYQESEQWLHDYEADEGGKIPAYIKRGVLSEDGLYSTLCDVEDVEDRMTRIVADLIDPDFPE